MSNSNQSPPSNTNRISKSWKVTFERHKTTNSQIIQDNYRSVNVGIPSKNFQEGNIQKVLGIQRHSSEDDFKKHIKNNNGNQTPDCLPPSSEDEYYTMHDELSGSRFKNNIKSNDKAIKFYPKNFKKQKGLSEPQTSYLKGYPLKQTTSTQSAQTLKNNSQFFSNGNNHRIQNYPTPVILQPLTPSIRKLKGSLTSTKHNLRRQNFKLICKLGEGKFGKVFMVKQVNTGFVLAMKIIQKKQIIKDNLFDQFIRQIKIQSFLNHPNIISMYGFFNDQTHFYILMQLGCDNQLYSLIANNKLLTEETTSFIVKNLLEAVTYIHQNQVLHRDIKPENIVLIMGNVKLCDFGWAVNKLHPGDLRNTFCGTPLYLSPEILQGYRYDEKVDLWAIGIMAYQLIFGCSPFDIADTSNLERIVTEQIQFPKQASEQFQQFITAMLTKNPKQRLSSRKLLELDFMYKYEQMETCEELCK